MQTVAQALALFPRREFSRMHYPHMYARWFLQENATFVPQPFLESDRIRLEKDGKAAKPTDPREHALIDWCEITGEDIDTVRVMLAEAYLLRHSIDAPPDRKPIF